MRGRQNRPAEPSQQIGASGHTGQRVLLGDLEALTELGLREVGQHRAIDPQRIARPLREFAIAEHHEARKREALGAAHVFAAHRIKESPVRSGAGIEQHADDDKIERGPGTLRGGRPCHRLVDFVPVVENRRYQNAASASETARRGWGRPRASCRSQAGPCLRGGRDRRESSAAGRRAPASGARGRERQRHSAVTSQQTRPTRSILFERPAGRILQVAGLLRLRRVIAGSLLGLDLDMGIGWHEIVRNRNALDDVDALETSASCFMSLMDTKRSMRRMPSQCSASGINCWKRASCTPATHSVRSK